jgi:hypothetical protein
MKLGILLCMKLGMSLGMKLGMSLGMKLGILLCIKLGMSLGMKLGISLGRKLGILESSIGEELIGASVDESLPLATGSDDAGTVVPGTILVVISDDMNVSKLVGANVITEEGTMGIVVMGVLVEDSVVDGANVVDDDDDDISLHSH